MSRWFDRKGQPMVDREAWAKLDDFEYKRVAFDVVANKHVSTVWLGLDHSPTNGSMSEELCQRYATEEAALAGHAAIVAEITRQK